jgi:predicted nucleotidyltransferase
VARLLIRSEQAEREAALRTIRLALEAQPGVVFAYVHGSFLADRPFHDVDVAVYLRPGDEEDMSWLALDLAVELEKSLARMPRRVATRLPVDVRVLNRAPLGFCYHVLWGRRLFSRDDVVHGRWVEQVLWRYLDLKPLRQRALKEAMTA